MNNQTDKVSPCGLEAFISNKSKVGEKELSLMIEKRKREVEEAIAKRAQELLIKEELQEKLKEEILYEIKYYKGSPQESYDYFYDFPVGNINNPESIIGFKIKEKDFMELKKITGIEVNGYIYEQFIFREWISIITGIRRKTICLDIKKQDLANSYIWNGKEFEKIDFSLNDQNVKNEYENIKAKVIKFNPRARNRTSQKAYNYLKPFSEEQILVLEIDGIKIFETIPVSEDDVENLNIEAIFQKWLKEDIFEEENILY